MRGKESRLRVTGLLDQFGLAEAADRQATGLDPQGRADLWAVLTGLVATTGTTILVTTHYLEEADQYAASVAIVDQGRIVAQRTPDELKAGVPARAVTVTTPTLDDVYLHHAGRSFRQAEKVALS